MILSRYNRQLAPKKNISARSGAGWTHTIMTKPVLRVGCAAVSKAPEFDSSGFMSELDMHLAEARK